jgi:hypothetical protein
MNPERIDRNRQIWTCYYCYEANSLDDVGKLYGVTRERIRQVIQKVDRNYYLDEIKRLRILVDMSNITDNPDDIRIVKTVINKDLPEKWYRNHIRLFRKWGKCYE